MKNLFIKTGFIFRISCCQLFLRYKEEKKKVSGIWYYGISHSIQQRLWIGLSLYLQLSLPTEATRPNLHGKETHPVSVKQKVLEFGGSAQDKWQSYLRGHPQQPSIAQTLMWRGIHPNSKLLQAKFLSSVGSLGTELGARAVCRDTTGHSRCLGSKFRYLTWMIYI